MERATRPRIVITVAWPDRQKEPALAARKNELYAEAVRRHGGEPILLHEGSTPETRQVAFAAMDGLILSGGADLDPTLYGEAVEGARELEPGRDALEREAWTIAGARALPVLGICRGLQAINVFLGGRLLQDLPGHAGPSYGHGPALCHELRLVPGTRLATILEADGSALTVNSYHHQAVRWMDLAASLRPSAWAASDAGDLVEGLELPGERFVVAIQCHVERTESTPRQLERIWAAFVEAAAGSMAGRLVRAGRGAEDR